MSTGSKESGLAAGTIFVAGVLLILAGFWQAMMGLVAVLSDTLYVTTASWVFELDVTAWGWIHMAIGVLLAVVGVFVLRGAGWAAIVAIVLAVLSAIANFLWLPYYPLWSILVIAVDVLVIWALAAHRESIHALDT